MFKSLQEETAGIVMASHKPTNLSHYELMIQLAQAKQEKLQSKKKFQSFSWAADRIQGIPLAQAKAKLQKKLKF